jgi:Arc/MetJ-type ribon-helix-helix transcriptional regulator
MRTFPLILSERRAAEVDAALASGSFASVSELVDAALDAFLATGDAPDPDRVAADIDDYRERRARGEAPLPADAAFEALLATLRR